jgi:hypothetical protein
VTCGGLAAARCFDAVYLPCLRRGDLHTIDTAGNLICSILRHRRWVGSA